MCCETVDFDNINLSERTERTKLLNNSSVHAPHLQLAFATDAINPASAAAQKKRQLKNQSPFTGVARITGRIYYDRRMHRINYEIVHLEKPSQVNKRERDINETYEAAGGFVPIYSVSIV